ncbi:PadR family transcriptional regulator [Kordia zhangzhouensis]|uniref:PadR family transcriptional regulator n=1 Tax=Kordia zhangzhouensis TaxID=1620405 RepID=UPI0006299F5C|nr:PadR family transcriptional regulator [Kordia zhangzhouensis]
MNSEFVQKWQSQVKKGTLAFILLNILKDNEFYGYELIEQVRKYTTIEIAEGTLYPLMNRLKKEGLVTSKWVEQESGIPRKYYQLTNVGISTLAEMRTYWDGLETAIQKLTK